MLRSFSRFQLCDTMDCSPPDSSVSPSRNTGMGCRALFQGLFPTQGSNPSLLHLLHCRFFSLMPQGKPQIDYSLIQTLQLELRHQVAQERCQDIEIPFLSSQDPGAHFFFFLMQKSSWDITNLLLEYFSCGFPLPSQKKKKFSFISKSSVGIVDSV